MPTRNGVIFFVKSQPRGAGLVKTPAPEMGTPWSKSGKQVANELFCVPVDSA
jgi:hypothetical protein